MSVQCFSSQRDSGRSDLIRRDSRWRDSNFCAHLFQVQKILTPSIFEIAAVSRVFTYLCIMSRRWDTVGNIRISYDGVKQVEYPLLGNLWSVASNGSRWIHPDAVINTPPQYSSLNLSMTLQTAEGYFLIIMYPSVNGSSHLVGLDCGWVNRHIAQTSSRTPKRLQASYRE